MNVNDNRNNIWAAPVYAHRCPTCRYGYNDPAPAFCPACEAPLAPPPPGAAAAARQGAEAAVAARRAAAANVAAGGPEADAAPGALQDRA
jgi:hypothetical protein